MASTTRGSAAYRANDAGERRPDHRVDLRSAIRNTAGKYSRSVLISVVGDQAEWNRRGFRRDRTARRRSGHGHHLTSLYHFTTTAPQDFFLANRHSYDIISPVTADMRTMIVYNPKSGKQTFAEHLPYVVERLSACGHDVTTNETAYPGQATELARRACEDKFDRIIIVGGDGTFNECVNGMMEYETRPVIGYIPAGTACDIGHTLGFVEGRRKGDRQHPLQHIRADGRRQGERPLLLLCFRQRGLHRHQLRHGFASEEENRLSGLSDQGGRRAHIDSQDADAGLLRQRRVPRQLLAHAHHQLEARRRHQHDLQTDARRRAASTWSSTAITSPSTTSSTSSRSSCRSGRRRWSSGSGPVR
ncbi:MAG: acylglycerol kinase family protein [Bacillus subtilis]|nr:acylglycerol kinase family protein [Bacillus subtilis]